MFQVVFNEALTKVVAEKDRKIDELEERSTFLQADSDKYRSKTTKSILYEKRDKFQERRKI